MTGDGTISRYFYGIEFPKRDFRLSLVEASEGKIGKTMDQILLYCFRYDPVEGKYTPYVLAFVRIGALSVLAFTVFLIIFLRRRERNT